MAPTRSLIVVLLGALLAAAPAASEPQAAAGSLDLHATIGLVSDGAPCPAGFPPESDCRARTGTSVVPGLGRVSEIYTWAFGLGPPTCPAFLARPLATTGRLVVAGKGEITFALADGAQCVGLEPVRNEPQNLTFTGGTASFAGASGTGKLEARAIGDGVGTEMLTGTLEVPGFTFDLTPPTLSGATSKTVRVPKKAKNARVAFKVTATDDVDGAVPVSCQPRSGSRFKLGKTKVSCEATDSSANTVKASFMITVKRR
jgi:hypothetical protein